MSTATLLLLALAGAEEPIDYATAIQPLMTSRCAGCHSGTNRQGGLDLSSHSSLLAGADSGPVIQAGQPEASLLMELVMPYDGLPPEMPPVDEGTPLTEDELDLLRRWIAEGAEPGSQAEPVRHAPEWYQALPIVTDLAFSPDGAHLAVTGRGEVLLHRFDGSELVARLAGASPRIESLAFSPDGRWLAVAGGTPGMAGELQLWDLEGRALKHSVKVASDALYGVSWSGDGTRVAFGGPDRALRVIEAASGEEVLFQMSHEDFVLGTAWSLDDSHLVSVSRDRSMKLVQVSTQQFIDNITSITPGALRGGLMAVARRPKADELLVGGADGVPKVYRMYREKKRVIGDDYNLIRSFEGLKGRVYDVAWTPDGETIVAVSSHAAGGQVRAAAAADGKSRWTRELPLGQYALSVHPDQPLVAAAGFDGRVRIFSLETGEEQHQYPAAPQLSTTPSPQDITERNP